MPCVLFPTFELRYCYSEKKGCISTNLMKACSNTHCVCLCPLYLKQNLGMLPWVSGMARTHLCTGVKCGGGQLSHQEQVLLFSWFIATVRIVAYSLALNFALFILSHPSLMNLSTSASLQCLSCPCSGGKVNLLHRHSKHHCINHWI